jgi:hypothetical protein
MVSREEERRGGTVGVELDVALEKVHHLVVVVGHHHPLAVHRRKDAVQAYATCIHRSLQGSPPAHLTSKRGTHTWPSAELEDGLVLEEVLVEHHPMAQDLGIGPHHLAQQMGVLHKITKKSH